MLKLGNFEFELDKVYNIELPDNAISEYGISCIQTEISTWRSNRELVLKEGSGYRNVSSYFSDDEVEYLWKNSQGIFTKRLSKYFYDTYGVKFTPSQLETIGNHAKSNSIDNKNFNIAITRNFNWRSGDFGDHGSCFWGDRNGARTMLDENGAYAVLFYKKGNNNERYYPKGYSGYGRAWLVNIDDGFIIFNAYGISLQSVAHILFSISNSSYYRKIYLYNNGDDTGILYINGSRGWIIGDIDKIKDLNEYDLGWDESYSTCDHCDRYIDEDDSYEVDGYYYCEDCYYDLFKECDDCGKVVSKDSTYYIESCEKEVCENCYRENYFDCDDCDETYKNKEANILENLDKTLCNNCTRNYTQCEQCNDWYIADEVCPNCVMEEEA